MSKLDGVIAILMVLWVMKLQLQCWGMTRDIIKLIDIAHFHLVEDYRDAYPEVSALYRKNDVPATGDRGKLHGAGPAVGDEAQDSASTESSVQGSTGPESRDS